MTEKIRKYISDVLERQGFLACEEYCFHEAAQGGIYRAFYSVESIELHKPLSSMTARKGCADIQVKIRLEGARADFSDYRELMLMAENVLSELFFESEEAVTEISCSKPERYIKAGRLECVIKAVFRTVAEGSVVS